MFTNAQKNYADWLLNECDNQFEEILWLITASKEDIEEQLEQYNEQKDVH
jgi:hypothetical protein